MSDREKAFMQALASLCQAYGLKLEVSISTEYLGNAVLNKPILSVVPIPGWQPPTATEEATTDETVG